MSSSWVNCLYSSSTEFSLKQLSPESPSSRRSAHANTKRLFGWRDTIHPPLLLCDLVVTPAVPVLDSLHLEPWALQLVGPSLLSVRGGREEKNRKRRKIFFVCVFFPVLRFQEYEVSSCSLRLSFSLRFFLGPVDFHGSTSLLPVISPFAICCHMAEFPSFDLFKASPALRSAVIHHSPTKRRGEDSREAVVVDSQVSE